MTHRGRILLLPLLMMLMMMTMIKTRGPINITPPPQLVSSSRDPHDPLTSKHNYWARRYKHVDKDESIPLNVAP